MDKIDCIKTFIQVVETGNFSTASRKLGITRDQVAKRICFLEEIYKTPLLIRDTRKMHLTLSGDRFYQHCKIIINEYDWAENELFSDQKYPEGTLRINAPHSFSKHYLVKAISLFMEQYPNIKIELFLSNEFINIKENQYDIIFRIKNDIEENAHLLGTFQICFYATPAYFNKHGIPKNLDDIKQHNILLYSQPNHSTKFYLTKDDKKYETIYFTSKLSCNSSDFLLECCKENQGIIIIPDFLVKYELDEGKLMRCLDEYHSPTLNLYALLSGKNKISKKSEFFLDFLKKEFNNTDFS